jgi:hypothetical protein
MSGLVKTLRLPALREPLTKLLGQVVPREELTTQSGVGAKVHHLVVAPPNANGKGFELWWAIQGQELLVLQGSNPSELGVFADATAGSKLGTRPELLAMAERRMPASIASFVDLAPSGTSGSAPVLFASGRRDGSARAEVEVSKAAAGLLLDMSGRP